MEKFIQISSTMNENAISPYVYALTNSGRIFQLIFDGFKDDYVWKEVALPTRSSITDDFIAEKFS